MEYDRSKMDWVDHPEQIWVAYAEDGGSGCLIEAHTTESGIEAARPRIAQENGDAFSVAEITLHKPSLRAVYGGPTLLEALWSRMDDHMEALMTGQEAEDTAAGARELAWVIAIVTNAYAPSIPWVREEAMRRWNESQAAAEEQHARWVAEQNDMMTRPAGADQ